MELRILVPKALLASTQGSEVLDSFRNDIVVEIEVDTASLFCSGVSNLKGRSPEPQVTTGGEAEDHIPLTSLVAVPALSRTGPSQDRSK